VKTEHSSTLRENVNLRTVLIALLVTVAGVALLVIGTFVTEWPSAVAASIGSVLFATGLLTVGWDLAGKRAFAREVLDAAELGADVRQAGLLRLTDQYLRKVEWEGLFRGASKIDIFVAYANSWRNAYRDELVTFLSDPSRELNVYLPDVDHHQTMDVMADRFKMSREELQQNVAVARSDYLSLAAEAAARVQIFVRKGDNTFSFYRFDGVGVLTFYSHTQRRTRVPTLVFRGGDLFRFMYGELEAIREQAHIIYPRSEHAADGA
jgi:hypothetical protein